MPMSRELVSSDVSSGGVDSNSDSSPKGRSAQKKTARKFRRPSGELEDVTGEWVKVQEEMATTSSDLNSLEEKVNSLLEAQDWEPIGPPPGLSRELVNEAERTSAEVNELKQRVFQAMLNIKRSAGLERRNSALLKKKVFQAMFNAKRSPSDEDKGSEMQALQLKKLMKRAFKGMRDSKRCSAPPDTSGANLHSGARHSGCLEADDCDRQEDLEMIAAQVVEQLQTKADSIKEQLRKGLLRAHRAGELLELKVELEELADSVSQMGEKLGGADSSSGLGSPSPNSPPKISPALGLSRSKRWSEYTSGESETEIVMPYPSPPPGFADFSDSDAESRRARRWGAGMLRGDAASAHDRCVSGLVSAPLRPEAAEFVPSSYALLGERQAKIEDVD